MMQQALQFITHSEAGYEHVNEDVVAVLPHPQDANALLCVLADGQGGQPGGGEASRIAVEACLNTASAYPVSSLLRNQTWHEIVAAADEAVSDAPDAGYTTLICLCVTPGQVCGASCGDSMALLVSGEHISVLTDDQRKNPPVGSGAAYPVAFRARLSGDWRLLLLSDGVWRYVELETIAQLSRTVDRVRLATALRRLQTEQNGGHLPDDFSLAAVWPYVG